jgi:NifU-like protein involved in Fe-S cluster formation
MLDSIVGKDRAEAEQICKNFLDYWQSGEGAEKIGEAGAFADIRMMPARAKCVTTVWRSFISHQNA